MRTHQYLALRRWGDYRLLQRHLRFLAFFDFRAPFLFDRCNFIRLHHSDIFHSKEMTLQISSSSPTPQYPQVGSGLIRTSALEPQWHCQLAVL